MLDFSSHKIFTIPNLISAFRIVVVPFIGWLLFIDSVAAKLIAALLLFLALLSDFLDGWLARLLNQVSDLGKIIDPLADKLFVILLAIELILLRDFPIWLAIVIVGKDVVIVGAGAFIVGRKRVVMQSNLIGKYAFGFQAGLVVCYFFAFPFGEWIFTIGTLVLIVASLVSYSKVLLFVVRSQEREVIVPQPEQIMPTWLRRSIVALLAAVFSVHAVYWMLENNEVALDPIDHFLVDDARASELAEKFAPILIFDSVDKARPMEVEDYLNRAYLKQGDRYLLAVLDGTVKEPPLNPSDLLLANGPNAYLVFAEPLQLDSSEISNTPAVYARAVEVKDGEGEWTVIQYWMLFPVEDTLTMRQGDWQMAAVYIGPDGEPKYLSLTQSFYGSSRLWKEIELEKYRPLVYVAPGSHSLYFTPGEQATYLDEERLIAFGSESVNGGQKIVNPEDYELIFIGASDREWLEWPGRWGGPLPGGDRGPRYWNPKKRYRAPWSYPMEFMRFYAEDLDRE